MFWSFVRDNTLTKLLFCLNQYGVHRMLTFISLTLNNMKQLDVSILLKIKNLKGVQ